MIIDSLHNAERIEGMNPYFKEVFDFLRSADLASLEPGRIDINGDNAWISVMETTGKPKDKAALETHDVYIDIQVLIEGRETFGWKPRRELKQVRPQDPAKTDIDFYDDDASFYFPLSPGCFAVFFPEDGHAPCVGEGNIKKLVAKVRCC